MNKKLKTIIEKIRLNMIFVLLIFLLIDLMIGGILFWYYGFYGINKDLQVTPPLVLNQSSLDEFSSRYSIREIEYNKALYKKYNNCFLNVFYVSE